MNALYRLHGVDGDVVHLTLAELSYTGGEFGPEVESAIRALAPGETYRDGGGAAPEWSIQRLTDEEAREVMRARIGAAYMRFQRECEEGASLERLTYLNEDIQRAYRAAKAFEASS